MKSLNRAHTASHDSARTRKLESCLPGTRSSVLHEIQDWITDTKKPSVFWLHGLAGIGKTTIARTVAEWADANGFLGASYFFARDVDDLRDPKLVITTLAFQLAQTDENLLEHIAKAIDSNPDIAHKEVERQFDVLLKGPFDEKKKSTTSWKKVVIVIDALDECAEEVRVEKILKAIVDYAPKMDSSIRVFITSRPEAHIRLVFDQDVKHQRIILHDVEESIVRSDIEAYLRNGLSHIHDDLGLRCPDEWPSSHQLRDLVDRSGTLFIYASIALLYIGDRRASNPSRRLEKVLSAHVRVNLRSRPYAALDTLYLHVLQSAFAEDEDDEDATQIRNVVGAIVFLRDPLPFSSFAKLLQMDRESVRQTLHHLHSIIIVPPPTIDGCDGPPRFFHPSLPDFITNAQRCTDERFLVKESQGEAYLALCCLEDMNCNLFYDMAGLGDEFASIPTWLDLENRLNRTLKPNLRYASKSWAEHLSRSRNSEHVAALVEAVSIFARDHILHWIESMVLIRCMERVRRSLSMARSWAVCRTLSRFSSFSTHQ